MRKITCNKGNWSGEEITVNIRKDGSFGLYGYEFKLKEKRSGDMVLYTLVGDQWKEPVATGYRADGERFQLNAYFISLVLREVADVTNGQSETDPRDVAGPGVRQRDIRHDVAARRLGAYGKSQQ